MRKLIDFLLFTSLFLTICAVLMVHQTAILFHLQPPLAFYIFVCGGTLCSYNFHWLLAKPIAVQTSCVKTVFTNGHRSIHLFLFVVGLILAVVSALWLRTAWLWLAATGLLTFLYSAPLINHPFSVRLRRIAIGKTIFLAGVWAFITVLLPLAAAHQLLAPQHLLFFFNRFFFIYAICILFDLRDVSADREAGVKSLVTWLSEPWVERLFWASVIISFESGLLLLKWIEPMQLVYLTLPGIILCALFTNARESRSDYLYYGILDGLMALSSLIIVLATFAR